MEAYQQLEKEWAEFNDLDPAGMVACASGTAALHLALEALQLPPGSEVIVPDFSMIACARAVTLAGLTPVFVDCGDDLLIDDSLLRDVVKPSGHGVKAILRVHVYGRQCQSLYNWYGWLEDGVRVIEDLAEAHGIKPHVETSAACWSFYRNKIIAGEEGGAIWFRSPRHADLARQLRSLGFTDAHDFNHVPRGHNYRMSNAHADLILRRLNLYVADVGFRSLKHRRQVEAWYEAACPLEWRMPPRQAPWVYDFRVRGMTSEQQNKIVGSLNQTGVAARHGFKSLRLQPEYCKPGVTYSDLGTRADVAGREIIYLPIGPDVTEAHAKVAFATVHRALGRPAADAPG